MSVANSNKGVSVQIKGLHKSFGPHEVLKGINLEIRSGEIFVIMGPSGGGKSIFLRQLIGLDSPDAGEVLVNGTKVEDESIRDRFRMAMVFQSGGLLNSLTVAENVGLYLSEHRVHPPKEIARIVREMLEAVQLSASDEEKNPTELSGGMKKRVAIARALVMEPQLVLYDEPTSELDPLVAITIGREIVKLNQRTGATTVVVSHDRDLAFGIADRIGFLSDGEILFVGTREEVRASKIPLIQEFISADFSVA